MVHHNRICPAVILDENADSNDESDDDYVSCTEEENKPDEEIQPTNNRYPKRKRTQRQIPGAIPWDMIQI